MSISAQNSYSSIKPDLRQRNRRSSDIEQQAYAAVGRRFAAGGSGSSSSSSSSSRVRYVRVVLGAAASITVVMLVTLVALLSYDNINSPHALKVAAPAKAEPRAAGPALAASARPVVIIDEKEEAPTRPVVAAAPVPPLVLLSPAELKPSAPPAPARLATAIKTPLKLREHARPAAGAGRQTALKAGKPMRAGARKEARGELRKAAPSPVKRKTSLLSMAAPARQGANGGALGTLLSYASVQRRYLAAPLPMLAARHAPRRRHLSEP
ncbi:hypothetical protein [Massilia mucilaginosa]|uniref:hypothetical protein n=1 Tax=Massilia mucilaginosa TaxID=2609282 RepID=UPI0014205BEF|nr:hypothetical protein [Massilia mucilaginosa]